MKEEQKSLSKWILIVSGIFALLEIIVSLSLYFLFSNVCWRLIYWNFTKRQFIHH